MKKCLSFALAAVMVFALGAGLVGCGGDGGGITGIVAVGHVVTFGGYEWRVLDVQGSSALLITEHIIELRPFHEVDDRDSFDGITWEHSDIRAWLNGPFLNRFSRADRNRIVQTMVRNDDNPWFGTAGGNNTQDHVFLLSLEEVVQYFGDSGELGRGRDGRWDFNDRYDNARVARINDWGVLERFVSEFGQRHGVTSVDDFGVDKLSFVTWWWLLRSPGLFANFAALVIYDGIVNVEGNLVNTDAAGVRPAMWVNL
ncbi:MAG: DUF6273 domain-containing protein [Oscillospiraceae bacterium]|nr:DUF6273 domain-containing protein [Oscillospiraceae bacterium]